MSVIIDGVVKGSVAEDYGFEAGDTLLEIDGNEIVDVLDYRFFENSEQFTVTVADKTGKRLYVDIIKAEDEDLGLTFNTYLMDKKHSCKNGCIFCFIDQLPKGLRESLYFKDDDSRLSFLFGNYITLTNLSEHEIERIIKMHISPVNISVHTTNPDLRVKMMKNKTAGETLKILKRLNDAGIKLNSQLVLCPGYNDGKELERTLADLTELENMECIAAVPVGLTKFRDNLTPIKSFDSQSAENVLKIIDKYGDKCLEKYKDRRIYASDEFYLLSGRKMPEAEYYGDFLQLENGVGLSALLKAEANDALKKIKKEKYNRTVSVVTGVAAFPLIQEIAENCEKIVSGLKCNVFAVKNDFFGEKITVSGLVTATDIIKQLKDKKLGEELLIPSTMLRKERDMFLDSITVEELEEKLGVRVTVCDADGYSLVNKITGKGGN